MANAVGEPIVSWQAQEYIQREKNIGWYVGLVIVAVILCVLSVILGWWTFLILVIVSTIALMVYSLRPPRTLHYSLTNKGIVVGDQLHKYDNYKAFGISQDDKHFSIVLLPRKRFSPRTTVYFPENQGEEIVDVFGARLPMQKVEPDFLDHIVKFLRI